MISRSLHIAWLSLIGLSMASTLLSLPALANFWPVSTGVAVLLLAWQKARIILAQYLGLAAAPTWRRGFNLALGGLFMVFLGLYMLPSLL